MPIPLNGNHVIYFFLFGFYIINSASISLLHAGHIREDIVLGCHPLIIEDLPVEVLRHFLLGV